MSDDTCPHGFSRRRLCGVCMLATPLGGGAAATSIMEDMRSTVDVNAHYIGCQRGLNGVGCTCASVDARPLPTLATRIAAVEAAVAKAEGGNGVPPVITPEQRTDWSAGTRPTARAILGHTTCSDRALTPDAITGEAEKRVVGALASNARPECMADDASRRVVAAAFDLVRAEAKRHGVDVEWIDGLDNLRDAALASSPRVG